MVIIIAYRFAAVQSEPCVVIQFVHYKISVNVRYRKSKLPRKTWAKTANMSDQCDIGRNIICTSYTHRKIRIVKITQQIHLKSHLLYEILCIFPPYFFGDAENSITWWNLINFSTKTIEIQIYWCNFVNSNSPCALLVCTLYGSKMLCVSMKIRSSIVLWLHLCQLNQRTILFEYIS